MGCYFHTHVLVYRYVLMPSADCWLIFLTCCLTSYRDSVPDIEGPLSCEDSLRCMNLHWHWNLDLKFSSGCPYYLQFRVLDKRIYFFLWTKIVADRYQTHDLPHKAAGVVKGRGCKDIDIKRCTLPLMIYMYI